MEDSKTKNMRAMDIMEMDIRLTEGNANFRIDACFDSYLSDISISSGFGYHCNIQKKVWVWLKRVPWNKEYYEIMYEGRNERCPFSGFYITTVNFTKKQLFLRQKSIKSRTYIENPYIYIRKKDVSYFLPENKTFKSKHGSGSRFICSVFSVLPNEYPVCFWHVASAWKHNGGYSPDWQ